MFVESIELELEFQIEDDGAVADISISHCALIPQFFLLFIMLPSLAAYGIQGLRIEQDPSVDQDLSLRLLLSCL